MMISEFSDGIRIKGQFLVSQSSKGVNAMGSSYYNVELRDSSGTIQAKKWEIINGDEALLTIGNVIEVEGEVLKYKENLQVKILNIKPVNEQEIDVTKFVKAPPIPKEELIAKFNKYVDSIKDEDCKKILNYFINKYQNQLFSFPAGVTVHHEYSSGLLVHITTMADIASYLAPIYKADYDLLITGVLLHDIGKVIEFVGPAVFKYSVEGRLLGHISIMCSLLKEAANELKITSNIPLLLEHMILSHHGSNEFGSPVVPLIKEAMLLSFIDNLDSKMVITNKALDATAKNEFTAKIASLDNRQLFNWEKM